MLKRIRIVWNLTLSCPYSCAICAAATGPHSSPSNDRLAILESISSVDIPVSFDFSGGDPLFLRQDATVIEKASSMFGQNNVEISTTGKSLLRYDDKYLLELADSYSLTYDYPKALADPIPGRYDYNRCNYEQALRLEQLGIPYEITIPIKPLPVNILTLLVEDLAKLHPRRIALIQLMPLGRNRNHDVIYCHSEANQLISLLHVAVPDAEISTNCALRNECNGMSECKFGLNESGDFFGCIWAADLSIPLSRNYFYLGNLYTETLSSILEHNATKIANLPRNFCYVIEQVSRPATLS